MCVCTLITIVGIRLEVSFWHWPEEIQANSIITASKASYPFLSKLQDFVPKIHISEEDFVAITNNGEWLDENRQVVLGFDQV